MMTLLRQLAISIVLVAIGCVRSDPRPRAELTYRAFKKIAGATGMGVNKMSYDALLQEAAAELLILGDLAPGTADSSTFRLYVSALEKYKDAGALWSEQVDDARYDWIPKGRIYMTNPAIVTRYKLETTDHKMPYAGTSFKTISSEGIQLIWVQAKIDSDSAEKTVIVQLRKLRD